ncbi:MAG: hypothetical protein WAN08_05185 [Candidatus Sulfotelmatobacter sp.]
MTSKIKGRIKSRIKSKIKSKIKNNVKGNGQACPELAEGSVRSTRYFPLWKTVENKWRDDLDFG